jgi:hypothetical protein
MKPPCNMARLLVLSLLPLGACHSAGLYGHSRVYSPLGEEESAARGARAYDLGSSSQRSASEYKGKPISAFGIVRSRIEGKGGASYVTLSVRALEPHNVCTTSDEDSCRVTVSEREHALIHAHVRLLGEDDIGKRSVSAGSLLRIIGLVSDEVDPNDGAPVVRPSYYRHWPRNYFVTAPERSEPKGEEPEEEPDQDQDQDKDKDEKEEE